VRPEERYELLEKLASGSFATVYRARDLELGREVAVKQIHQQYLDDPQQLERYWQEAQLLAQLHHPNIVTIFDIVRERGWLIMELMQGNLAARQAGRPMDLNSLRTVIAHSLRALKFLHEHGIIHGDIKPSNLMVDRRKRVKIGDFGLARRASNEEGSLLKGTTKYMAPEVLSDDFGEIGPASDLYSLGFAAYELMCGDNFESLFPGLSAFGRDKQVAWMMWHAAPDRRLPQIHRVLQGVPDDLAHVIQKLTAKNQADRYSSADEALIDLKIDLKPVRSGESAETTTAPVDTAASRKRMLAIGGFAMSLLMCLLMLFLPGGEQRAPKLPLTKSGIVREVRAATNQLVIEDEESGVPEIIEALPRIFLIDGKSRQYVLLEQLQRGDRVQVEPGPGSAGQSQPELVAARPATSQGTLRRIDQATRQLAVEVDEGALHGELLLRVPERAEIQLNGSKTDLASLAINDRVEVRHLADIRNKDRQVAETVEARRTERTIGFVQSVDPEKGTVTIEQRQGSRSTSRTLPFADRAQVTLPGGRAIGRKDLKASDLQRGDRVVLYHDTHITALTASRNQQLAGIIEELNEEERTLVVGTPSGETFPLHIVPEETQIEIGGEPGQLPDLRQYDQVQVTFSEAPGGVRNAATVDATRPLKHDRWAIIVGMQHYDDRSLARNPQALADANLIADALRKRYAFAPERLLLMKDPTHQELKQSISKLLGQALGQTQVLIYYCGHGFADAEGHIYLMARDFNPQRPAETGLPLQWLGEQMEGCAAKDKLLLLDCCPQPAGSASQPTLTAEAILRRATTGPDSVEFSSTAVIAACGESAKTPVASEGEQGPFAASVAEGFRGAADADRDLRITAAELFAYIEPELARRQRDGAQLPVLFSAGR